ncbi:HNH endonuclease [Mycobacterium phage SuperGrey]|uniref:HNH endonuclease n=12 Tax=Cheoctovirus TaxID=1623281 RepID=A0A1J0GQU8_9CAUD|nr:HNH endonuclease [Mycobacterium phage Job42]YP_009125008.1 HNH endonuclease [Mycobacterium phage BuzzLyseyear]YP_009956153.1 HNH endonuclease [Mycobacterium phage Doug]YP_009959887.1 HNH endonuclease [Mycobacterium phage Minnie]YP_009962784.1 HNH endonuclease [Mycobacterium phage SuperGrey]QOP65453.1 HNH endonuclease [Mycobacterium phage Coco12]AGM61431.1 HNH endonuclease [Mycobacterium phage Job42]AIM50137.1 HNH endonuclease [Mycobacterium phage BuzzLyseyear]APC43511.1 HNH endonuclease 
MTGGECLMCAIDGCDRRVFSHKNGLCATHDRYLRRFGIAEPTLQQRLFAKVDKSAPGGCWLWTGGTTNHGYGRFNNLSPHRLCYEWAHGEIPPGMEIDHICHVTLCVNPDHLRVTTAKQNRENRSSGWGRSGVRGVRFKAGKWEAVVVHNRQHIYCGRFESKESAAAAAKAKRIELFTHNDGDRGA